MAERQGDMRSTIHESPLSPHLQKFIRRAVCTSSPVKLTCSWSTTPENITYDLSSEFANHHVGSIIVLARTARKVTITREKRTRT